LNYKNKILIISGNLPKHKYTAIKILKKFNNSYVIFERYPKKVSTNYTKNKSKIIENHFKTVLYYENIFFKKFNEKNKNFLKRKTLFNINKGKINNLKTLKLIKKVKPSLIILNATSVVKKFFLDIFINKVINIHAGLMPYYRGAGCNVWTFYNQELEYTGITIHFVNEKIDKGNILLQSQSNFTKNDNSHTIGCKNAKLSGKLAIKVIKHLIKHPNYKGKKIKSIKSKMYYKKDFNKDIVLRVNQLIKDGLVSKFLSKKKKINLVNHL